MSPPVTYSDGVFFSHPTSHKRVFSVIPELSDYGLPCLTPRYDTKSPSDRVGIPRLYYGREDCKHESEYFSRKPELCLFDEI